MKRIVSVFLSVLMLLCCVIPASASSADIDSSIDDYKLDVTPYFNQTYYDISAGSNSSYYTLSTSQFSSSFTFKYIDIIVESDDSNPRMSAEESVLTMARISDNLYRFYGVVDSDNATDFWLTFFKRGNGTYFNVLKCDITLTDYTVDYIPLNYSITGRYKRQVVDAWADGQPVTNEWFDINIDSSAPNPGDIFTPKIEPNINSDGSFRSDNSTNVFLTTNLKFDWRPYDRVDLYFYNNFTLIIDYACYVGSINVVSSIQQTTIHNQKGTIVSLDFTDLNRSTDNPNCYLRIRGYADLSSKSRYQLYHIFNAVGFVKYVSSNFWPSWLTKIIGKLDNIFTGREQDQAGANSFNDSINDQSNELEDLTADLNSVTRPPLSDVNLSTSGMVDQSVVVLSTNGIGSILSNQIILRVLIMSLTFALAGFILFGKR